MARDDTQDRTGTEQRSLVALTQPGSRDALHHRAMGGRPLAPFLTQLIVGNDPALRPARLERTRNAAALYARTATRA